MRMQPQLDLYRASLRSAADLMKSSLETTQRLHQLAEQERQAQGQRPKREGQAPV